MLSLGELIYHDFDPLLLMVFIWCYYIYIYIYVLESFRYVFRFNGILE